MALQFVYVLFILILKEHPMKTKIGLTIGQ